MGERRPIADHSPTMSDFRGPAGLAHQPPFRLGAAEVRPATREVVVPGHREVLQPRVMQVLTTLAGSRGQVLSREDLLERCWGGRIVGEDAIQRCIGQLRKLADAVGGFHLETIPRVGYRLVETGVRRAPPRRRPWALLWAALVGAAGLAGLWSWETSRGVSAAATPSVAVLPFENLGGGQTLATRMESRVGDTLARSGLPVIEAPSTGSGRPGARYLVEGDVSQPNGVAQVSARLVDGRTGMTVGTLTLPVAAGRETAVADEMARTLAVVLTWQG
jgi:DNA-binding winged helix-turn-helix (wHTH) protein/TolB-like protein